MVAPVPNFPSMDDSESTRQFGQAVLEWAHATRRAIDGVGASPASAVTVTPTGLIIATNVQAALAELDTEKVPTTRTISTTAPVTGGGDLSANRTIAVSAASATAQGIVELLTDAEAITGTDTTRAMTAANNAAVDADKITAWTGVTFANSWTDVGGTQACQYRKIGDRVFLRGRMASGTMALAAFTLPVGFRPPALLDVSTSSISGATWIFGFADISTGGVFTPYVGGNVAFNINCNFSVTA